MDVSSHCALNWHKTFNNSFDELFEYDQTSLRQWASEIYILLFIPFHNVHYIDCTDNSIMDHWKRNAFLHSGSFPWQTWHFDKSHKTFTKSISFIYRSRLRDPLCSTEAVGSSSQRQTLSSSPAGPHWHTTCGQHLPHFPTPTSATGRTRPTLPHHPTSAETESHHTDSEASGSGPCWTFAREGIPVCNE